MVAALPPIQRLGQANRHKKTAPSAKDNAVSIQTPCHARRDPAHPSTAGLARRDAYASNANSYRPQAAAIMITSYAAAMPHELQNVPNVPSTPINATVVAETHA